MPAAEDLLARTPGWDASAGGRDGGRMGVVEGVAGEGTEAGWKGEARFAPARCLRAAARPVGGGTLRRLGTGSADRQVSQVETGAAGERCTAGGWDAFQSWRRESREQSREQHGMHWTDTAGGQTHWTDRQQLGRRASSAAAATPRGFRGLAPRKEMRYAQTNGRHAGNADDARA
jgi:hypothetical protein